MYDTIQPFTTLANANMAAFARLTKASVVPDSTRTGDDAESNAAAGILAWSNLTKALVEWGQAIAQNQTAFFNEWTRMLYGMFWQGQALVTSQTQELSQELQHGLEEIVQAEANVVDAAGSESVISMESAKQRTKAG